MIAHYPTSETRVTLASGDQYTLAELIGESVEIYLVNSDAVKERQNANHSRP